MDIMTHRIPSKYNSLRHHQPWINRSINQVSRHKQCLYNRACHSGLADDWDAYKQFKHYTQRQCKDAYNDYIQGIVSTESNSNPKCFWSFIKSKRLDYCGVGTLKSNGQVYSSNYSKSHLLHKYFASVFNEDTSDSLPELPNSPYSDISRISVTLNGVINLLQNLKEFKAYGLDKIPNRLLKEYAVEVTSSLTLLFQASINQSVVPTEWKHALVPPVFKKGDCSLASNY